MIKQLGVEADTILKIDPFLERVYQESYWGSRGCWIDSEYIDPELQKLYLEGKFAVRPRTEELDRQ